MKHITEVNMLSGPITKGLIALSIPIMIMNVSQSLFNIIDMTVLGKLVDDSAVGAVGACGMLITLITCLLIGISSGANVVIARHIGKGDTKRAEQAIGTGVLFGAVGGIFLMIFGVALARFFLTLTHCPESLMDSAVLYFRLYFCGAPFLMVYNFCAAVLRSQGDTRRPMLFLLFAGGIKVLLNFLLIIVFDLAVEGVGIATIIANLIAGGLSFYAVVHGGHGVRFRFENLRFYAEELKSILFIGIPAGLQSAMYALANVVITTAVNRYGADATTGIAIANQFDGILYQISYAPAVAAMPYVAQNVGAGNVKRVKQAVIKAILITTAFGAGFGALSAIFSGQLSSLMSQTPAVIAYSQQKMVIISSTYFICGINEVMNSAMRGLGRPMIPTVATLVFMCALRFIWVYLLFPLCPNFTFLYSVWPIGWVCCIITALFFYFPTLSKIDKKECIA